MRYFHIRKINEIKTRFKKVKLKKFYLFFIYLSLTPVKNVHNKIKHKGGTRVKIGIALSGGGIRGIAHAGVLQALKDQNIPISIIGGTSAGSMVASLYAMGYSPYVIYQLFKMHSKEIIGTSHVPWVSRLLHFPFGKKFTLKGFHNGEDIENLYNRLAKQKNITNINQVPMPLVIPTVDIMKSKEYIFTNMVPQEATDKTQYITDISIGKAVRASSSFPAVFSPCYMEKHAFMDGGALDNIPVHEVKKQGADKVIAVKFDSDPIDEDSNLMDIVMKSIDIMGSKISEQSLEMSDFVLNVYTDKVGLLDVEKLDKCYEYGYQSVMEHLEELKTLLLR